MMKKIVIAFIVLLCTSCSFNKASNRAYYLLNVKTESFNDKQQRSQLIWVDTITVSDFLNQQGIVYQTSDLTYNVAKQNTWLTPLDIQLADIITNVLLQEFPSTLVSSRRLITPKATIDVQIDGFHGRYDGKVIVKGKWLASFNRRDNAFYTQDFEYAIDQPEEGYDSLIETLSSTFQQEIERFAANLKNKMK